MSLFNFFKRDSTPTNPQSLQSEEFRLPANFAHTCMELEMHMQFRESCNMDIIQKLNELYRMAIEYYSNENDMKKAEHFHRKLTSLLNNPNTIDIIEKKDRTAAKNTVDTGAYSNSLKQQLNKFNTQSELVVKAMIEGNKKKAEHHSRLISEETETQDEKLRRRLEERSRSKSKKQS